METETLLSASSALCLVISKIRITADEQGGKPGKTFNAGMFSKQPQVWAANSSLLCCSALCCPACDLLPSRRACLWKLAEYTCCMAFIIQPPQSLSHFYSSVEWSVSFSGEELNGNQALACGSSQGCQLVGTGSVILHTIRRERKKAIICEELF